MLLDIFFPIVFAPEPPPQVETIELEPYTITFLDPTVPQEDIILWELNGPVEFSPLNPDFTFYAPKYYLITAMVLYTYEDSMYRSFGNIYGRDEACMPAFTYMDGGPNYNIGGEWCNYTIVAYEGAIGYSSYRFTNTSPYDTDVLIFRLVPDPAPGGSDGN